MTRGRYQFSPAARRDLFDIQAYLEATAPDSIDSVMDAIEAACSLLSENPDAGRTRPEIDRRVRSFPVGSYLIFYYPRLDPVGIARILHERRDLRPAFRNR